MNAIKKLAVDTLHERRVGPEGSCFRTNQAGEELAESDSSAIPFIEELILQEVVPAAGALEASGGLKYLLGAYLVIGVRESRGDVFDFVEGLPDGIVRKAVGCCSTFFRKTDKGFSFGVAPSKAVIDFLSRVESSGVKDTRDLAREVRAEIEAYR